MYLAFLSLIIIPPVLVTGIVTFYCCFRRYKKRRSIERMGQQTATVAVSNEANQTEMGIQVESGQANNAEEDAIAASLEELHWSPSDDIRFMHLLSYMNSLLESGTLGELNNHSSPFSPPFAVTQPPSYDEVMSTAKYKVVNPPSYSSVAHIKPQSMSATASGASSVNDVGSPVPYDLPVSLSVSEAFADTAASNQQINTGSFITCYEDQSCNDSASFVTVESGILNDSIMINPSQIFNRSVEEITRYNDDDASNIRLSSDRSNSNIDDDGNVIILYSADALDSSSLSDIGEPHVAFNDHQSAQHRLSPIVIA